MGGSTILSSSNETFASYSSSVDSRLDTIEGPLSTSIDGRLDFLSAVSHSHANKATLDGINQGLATSDNVTFADGDFTGDVQVTGNLTVLGSATEISSTELKIEDKLITVASGSADSAAADGAGIEIDGAGKSLKWDHNTTSFVLDAKVSSSVGFKGEGGELTGIDTDQVTEGSNLYYTDTRVKTKLNSELVVSGSSQINYSLLSGINNNIISSSSDTSQVDMIINGGSISANLKGGVVSGSSQIDADQTTGWVADVRKQIDDVGLISGSSQVNANTITNFDANVKTKLDDETVVSGSAQIQSLLPSGTVSGSAQSVSHITSGDLDMGGNKVLFGNVYTNEGDLPNAGTYHGMFAHVHNTGRGYFAHGGNWIPLVNLSDGTFSGSAQVDHDSTTNFVANEHIDHSSITVGSGKGLSGGGTIDTNRSLFLDTGSAHFDEGIKKVIDGDGVISGSGFSSPSQGTVRATINGVNTDVDTGLQTGDSPEFTTLTLSNVAAGGATDFDALFNVSGLTKKRTIGTAAFLNVSASIADDPNSIPTTKAVNDALVEAGAGDITSVNTSNLYPSASTGIAHTSQGTVDGSGRFGNVGNVVLAIDTGSAHFQQGVELYSSNINASGLISGSAQLANSSVSNESLNAATSSYLTTVDISSNTNLAVSDTTNVDMILTGDTISANIKGGIFSGSAQVAAGGDVSGNVNSLTVEKIQGVSLTSGEATQLATIGTSTISSTQWGYLGGMDQDVKTTSDVTFASASLSNVVISGNLKVLGDSVEIAVSDLKIEDKLITVASGSSDSAASDGAGIEIAGANESITWDHGNSRFAISDDIHVTGTIKASDDIIAYASSDIELKNNVKPIDNPLEKIKSISGNSFDWNEEKQDIYKGKDYGVIAQEIEKVLPELVVTRENGYKAVKYDKLVSLLIEGIKDLSKQIDELKNK